MQEMTKSSNSPLEPLAPNQSLVSESEALRSTLRAAGYSVREITADDFELSLPLWCSVRVAVGPGGLRLEPRFGAARRSVAIVLTYAILGLAALAGAARGQTGIWALVLSLAVAWDACRYYLTKRAMSKVLKAHAASLKSAPGSGRVKPNKEE